MEFEIGPEDFQELESETARESAATSSFQYVRTARDGACFRIELARPPLHYIDLTMLEELHQIIGNLVFDEQVKVITLTASGEYFSAGLDPRCMQSDDLFVVVDRFHRLVTQIIRMQPLVVGLINGHAYGAGCLIAAICDYTFAPSTARFGHPEMKYGHFAPLALLLYPRFMPKNRALYLAMTGEVVDAKTAAAWGLISWALPPDQWKVQADRFVQRLLTMSTQALQYARQTFWHTLIPDWDDRVREVEEFYLVQYASTEDAREGIRAWLEQRAPKWRHVE